jgi:hypothetical protein
LLRSDPIDLRAIPTGIAQSHAAKLIFDASEHAAKIDEVDTKQLQNKNIP